MTGLVEHWSVMDLFNGSPQWWHLITWKISNSRMQSEIIVSGRGHKDEEETHMCYLFVYLAQEERKGNCPWSDVYICCNSQVKYRSRVRCILVAPGCSHWSWRTEQKRFEQGGTALSVIFNRWILCQSVWPAAMNQKLSYVVQRTLGWWKEEDNQSIQLWKWKGIFTT